MAEEKKPKIDLKARLGKTMVGMQPPAPQPGGDPAAGIPAPPVVAAPQQNVVMPMAPVVPGAPPAGLPPPVIGPSGGGLPPPPFATQQRQPARPSGPVVDPTDPYAAAQPARKPQPQEIRVEVGAEAVEAAKAIKKFIAVAGVAGVVVGLAMGYIVGQGSERSSKEKSAIEGAGLLAKDVDAANVKINALNDKIGEAVKSLKDKKFPDTFANDLGGINVPFDGDKLVGKGVGSYDTATMKMLFQYTADVQALSSRKDALAGLFSGQKKKIIEALAAGQNPLIAYTLLIVKGPKGAVGSLAPIQDAFGLSADWPKEFKMTNLITREVQPVTRYDSGDIFSTADKRVGIPIEPQSLGAAFPNDVSTKVLSELSKTAELLNGVEPAAGSDDEPRPGLIKNGQKLAEALKKIGAKLEPRRRTRRSAFSKEKRSVGV